MKTKNLKINSWLSLAFMGVISLSMLMNSCKNDEASAGPITITKVYLEDVNSSVSDREVDFVRLGQMIRVEGSGFLGLRKAYINGYKTYFNPTLVSDGSMIMRVAKETPLVDADPEFRNTIKLENDSYSAIFDIEVRDAAPTIKYISHTLPLAGESITIYGTGLIEVSKVVFPGDIEVTDGIISDNEKGLFCMVTVPEGISDAGGSIYVECSNGGAYSPAYFNCEQGVILDFDGNGTHGYWVLSDSSNVISMIQAKDLDSVAIGTKHVSQGKYAPHRPSRITQFDPATTRCSEVWTAGNGVDDWRGQLTPLIPTTTPVDEVAFQFDIYVPNEWANTGYLQICLYNSFNGGEWKQHVYNVVPWLVNGEIVPFKTDGWTTITVPFSKFYAYSDGEFTFEDVIAKREEYDDTPNNKYKNFGIMFNNKEIKLQDITGEDSDIVYAPDVFTAEVYTDNWRVVSLETPPYSDFPETTEE